MEAHAYARSLYRAILRELPARSIKQPASPLRASIRNHFQAPQNLASTASPEYALARRQEMEQAVQYLKAQRTYGALLERYNPGADMTEEDRVRLTARRVGMDMPEEWYGKGQPGKFGNIQYEKKTEEWYSKGQAGQYKKKE
ncbi:hypothetical protein LTR70_003025 [Exophiala xenobiotica]|uniref:Uncharacterized protein n=1 Tax=Lithohypha guttulata TaxID=1690604 RepID=A0ABR0K9T2_9EURO|nr:hypothetical protein LTR24_005705 [Lithohypha guttulata]KAK5324395.1 hypothetical protein LTR70_003025 [Exophiala xenobiotica]